MLRSAHAKAVSGPGVTFLTEVRAFSGEIILRKISDLWSFFSCENISVMLHESDILSSPYQTGLASCC